MDLESTFGESPLVQDSYPFTGLARMLHSLLTERILG